MNPRCAMEKLVSRLAHNQEAASSSLARATRSDRGRSVTLPPRTKVPLEEYFGWRQSAHALMVLIDLKQKLGKCGLRILWLPRCSPGTQPERT